MPGPPGATRFPFPIWFIDTLELKCGMSAGAPTRDRPTVARGLARLSRRAARWELVRPLMATALTVNAGSSSLKIALFEVRPAERSIVAAEVDRIGEPDSMLRLSCGGAPETVGPIEAT